MGGIVRLPKASRPQANGSFLQFVPGGATLTLRRNAAQSNNVRRKGQIGEKTRGCSRVGDETFHNSTGASESDRRRPEYVPANRACFRGVLVFAPGGRFCLRGRGEQVAP